jgi:hypothetical protein
LSRPDTLSRWLAIQSRFGEAARRARRQRHWRRRFPFAAIHRCIGRRSQSSKRRWRLRLGGGGSQLEANPATRRPKNFTRRWCASRQRPSPWRRGKTRLSRTSRCHCHPAGKSHTGVVRTLEQGFDIAPQVDPWLTALRWLFKDVRDTLVHSQESDETPVPHPAGGIPRRRWSVSRWKRP